jgi:hypothetical protein
MSRQSTLPTERFHFFAYSSDLEWLRKRFGNEAPSSNQYGVGPAIREIVHSAVNKARARERRAIDEAIQRQDKEQEYATDSSD